MSDKWADISENRGFYRKKIGFKIKFGTVIVVWMMR